MRAYEIFEDLAPVRNLTPQEAEEIIEIIKDWDPSPIERDDGWRQYDSYLEDNYPDTNISDLLAQKDDINNKNWDGSGHDWLIGQLESIADGSIDVDEGWKDWAAAGALATGVALGGHGLYKNTNQDVAKDATPAVTQQTQEPQKTAKAPQDTTSIPSSLSGSPREDMLKAAAVKAGIRGDELAALLSQCAHETYDFARLTEKGGSLDFRKYDPKYAPKKAAALGNKYAGDGAKYKGRGFIMLTGRYNYKKAGEALNLPLEQHPDLLEKPDVAVKAAIWYWKQRVQSKVDDFRVPDNVTKTINPGMHGADQRASKYDDYKDTMLVKRESIGKSRRVEPISPSSKTNTQYPPYPTPKHQKPKEFDKKDEKKPPQKDVYVHISDAGRKMNK